MKYTLITLFILTSISVKGQTKHYYKAEIKYTLDCSSGYSSQTIIGDSYANYNTIKNSFKKWVYPHRVISFEITSLKVVKRKEANLKKEKFKCPDQVKFDFGLLTSTSLYCDTCKFTLSGSLYYSNSLYISGTTKPILIVKPFKYSKSGSLDSIEVEVKKSQIKWLNDSTAVIYKP